MPRLSNLQHSHSTPATAQHAFRERQVLRRPKAHQSFPRFSSFFRVSPTHTSTRVALPVGLPPVPYTLHQAFQADPHRNATPSAFLTRPRGHAVDVPVPPRMRLCSVRDLPPLNPPPRAACAIPMHLCTLPFTSHLPSSMATHNTPMHACLLKPRPCVGSPPRGCAKANPLPSLTTARRVLRCRGWRTACMPLIPQCPTPAPSLLPHVTSTNGVWACAQCASA